MRPSGPPEEVVNCFLPGTLVEGRFVAGLKARYAGPAREIKTARGARLSVTPNHPILTPDGWLPACALQKGDYCLGYSRNGRNAMQRAVHAKHGPTPIEDVFESLATKRTPRTTMVVALDLHGDAEFTDRKIDVVDADRVLRLDAKALRLKTASDLQLVFSNTEQVAVNRSGSPSLLVETRLPSAASSPRGGTLACHRPAAFLEPRPLEKFSLGATAYLNIMKPEPAGEDAAIDAKFIRELLHADPSLIAPDQIMEVRDFDYAGHVFDLQSTTGWLLAQGIVSSNCRCVLLMIRPDWGAPVPQERAAGVTA